MDFEAQDEGVVAKILMQAGGGTFSIIEEKTENHVNEFTNPLLP